MVLYDLIGLESYFLAVIDPNSFGLASYCVQFVDEQESVT